MSAVEGRFEPGQVIVRREVWRGLPWSATAVVVIEDSPGLLALHVPVGAPFGFVPDHPLGVHPWSQADSWQGIDVVMVQRPGDAHSVWFFGPWATYVNLQSPFTRTAVGVDTMDHDLDVVVAPDGRWSFKDEDHLEASVVSGRFTVDEAAAIRGEGDRVGRSIDTGAAWWSSEWSKWSPPDPWPTPTLRHDWASAH